MSQRRGTTIDWTIDSGGEIEIEERDALEVTHIWGRLDDGRTARVALAPVGTRAANPAFDVTPAELIDGIITERGVLGADKAALAKALGGRGGVKRRGMPWRLPVFPVWWPQCAQRLLSPAIPSGCKKLNTCRCWREIL
jgi:hypothetical protein